MSSTITKGEPWPFNVKTTVMQLVGIACSTPDDIGEMQVKIDRLISDSINVRIYPGGYEAGKNNVFDETANIGGLTEEEAVKKLTELVNKTNTILATGRQTKIAALKSKAAEMLKLAEGLEAALANVEN